MLVLVAGVVWAGLAVGLVVVVSRQVTRVSTETVAAVAKAMWGPQVVAQPESAPLEQPEPGETMFPPWEEEPWSLDVDDPISRPEPT